MSLLLPQLTDGAFQHLLYRKVIPLPTRSDSFKRFLEDMTDHYRSAGMPWPATTGDVAKWMLSTGKIDINHPTLVRVLGDLLGQTWREERRKDGQGRTVRSKHSAKVREGGQLKLVWFDSAGAPRELMVHSVQNTRRMITGVITQAQIDVDSYNENDNIGEPIPWSNDFREEVHQQLILRKMSPPDITWEDEIEGEDEGWDD